MNKYAGLTKIAFGEGFEAWQNKHPVGSALAYMTPGVGVAASGADALRDFSRGHVVSGLGNTLFAAASLLPFGGLLKGLGRAGMAGAKAVGTAAKVAPEAKGLWGGTKQMLGRVANNPLFNPEPYAEQYGARLPGFANHIQPNAQALHGAGEAMSRFAEPLGGWKGMIGGMGMTMAGDMMHPQPQPSPYAGLNNITGTNY